VRLYRTTLFGSWFTALQAPAASRASGDPVGVKTTPWSSQHIERHREGPVFHPSPDSGESDATGQPQDFGLRDHPGQRAYLRCRRIVTIIAGIGNATHRPAEGGGFFLGSDGLAGCF